ncbi:hypothetical protein PspS34_03095 [Pseudomonas sp. S34]|nr:hypothetical protein PspS34_03095 [Pseudomonas sp. S34]
MRGGRAGRDRHYRALNRNNCGSGLAREEAISFNIPVDCHTAFASKPAPTGFVPGSDYVSDTETLWE